MNDRVRPSDVTAGRRGRPRTRWAAGVLAVLGGVAAFFVLARGERGGNADVPRENGSRAVEPGVAGEVAGAEAAPLAPPVDAVGPGTARRGGGLLARTLRVVLETDLVPFDDLVVRLERRAAAPWSDERWVREETTWEELAPAVHELTVTGAGWEDERLGIDLAAAEPSSEVVVALRPLVSFTGRVVDAVTGASLPRFRLRREVSYRPPSSPAMVYPNRSLEISDPEGRFAVGGIPLDGDGVRLVVEAEGYDPDATGWLPPGTDVAGLVVELWPRGRGAFAVEGRVVEASSGRGLGGARVRLVAPDLDPDELPLAAAPLSGPDVGEAEGFGPAARTAADGSFRLEARAAGTVRVLASHAEYLPAAGDPLVLRRGETVRAGDVRLARGARIAGRVVVDPSLEPPPRLGNVVAHGERGALATEMDGDGRFRFAGLAPGRWRVLARATVATAGGEDVLQTGATVELAAGGEAEVVLHVGPRTDGLVVAGRVLPPSAELDRWSVGLVDVETGESRAAAAGPDGAFQLDGVAPSRYLLAAQGASDDGSRIALVWRELAVEPSGGTPFLVLECAPRETVLLRGTCAEGGFALSLETELDDPLLAGIAQGGLGPFAFDSEGRFVAHGLPAGHYVARCGGSETPFRVFPGSTGTDEIVLGD